MRFIGWNIGLATWLLLSLFLPHTLRSATLTAVVAVLVAAVSIASPGVRGLRHANAVLALVLGWGTLLSPGVSWAARINNVAVAAAVLVIALVPGRSTYPPRKIMWLAWRNPSPPPPPEAEPRDPPPAGGPGGEDRSVPRADRC